MKKHYRHIDVIKGICILIVIIEHAKWDRAFRLRCLFPFWDRIAIPCFMVISGFVYAKSLEGKTIKEYYSFENITRKLKRYLLPFLFVFILENLFYLILSRPAVLAYLMERFQYDFSAETVSIFTPYNLLKSLIIGGYGPGNYYTPVLVQLVLLFPLIYLFIKKFKYPGLVASAIFCLFAELWQYSIGLPRTIYRNLILRHMMTISFGVYLSQGYYKKDKFYNILSLLIGFSYIIAHSYYMWTPAFFNNGWADVNFVACLFFCPVIAFFLGKEKMHFKPLEYIGKASYHVYLTQMVYYNFVKREIMISILKSPFLWCGLSMLIIVSVGCLFYKAEMSLRKRFLENKTAE